MTETDPVGGSFAEFLDELGNRDEIYKWVVETLEREATPEQRNALRRLLERDPPWSCKASINTQHRRDQMDEAFKDMEEWVLAIRRYTTEPTEKRMERLAHSIVLAVQAAEQSGFLEAKKMMQKRLNEMRWDIT